MAPDETRSAERRTPAIVEEAGGGGSIGAVVQATKRIVRNAAVDLMESNDARCGRSHGSPFALNLTGGTRYLPLHGWFSRWPDVTGPSVRRCRFHVRYAVSSSSSTAAVGRTSGREHSFTFRVVIPPARTRNIWIWRQEWPIRSHRSRRNLTRPDHKRRMP